MQILANDIDYPACLVVPDYLPCAEYLSKSGGGYLHVETGGNFAFLPWEITSAPGPAASQKKDSRTGGELASSQAAPLPTA